jgi:hypothetical protein
MRNYEYCTYGELDAYGMPSVSDAKGTIKIALEIASQEVNESVKYSGCTYIGFTHADIDDTYIIKTDDADLKVMYVNPRGRFKQVFLREM